MARVTAAEYAEKWGRRLKGATTDIARGIERVTVAPGQQAARAQETMRAKLNAAIDDGTWARQVAGVPLDEWKRAATQKGVQRLAAGVDAAQPNQAAMAERLLAAVDATRTEVNQTPRGDIEANINRMTTFARGMHKRKLRRG
jgi:hypothetical protein